MGSASTTAPTDAAPAAVFDALVAVARPLILQRFRPNSCIASTRIGIDALAYFGVRAAPVPLVVAVFNAEAQTMLDGGATLDDLGAAAATIGPDAPGGPWTVGVGMLGPDAGQDPGSLDGHLLIAVPDEDVVIDLSLDQATRPHKGITLAPYWARLDTPDWFTDPQSVASLRQNTDGALLVLDRSSVPDPQRYLTSPNWDPPTAKHRAPLREVTGQVIRAMKQTLQA